MGICSFLHEYTFDIEQIVNLIFLIFERKNKIYFNIICSNIFPKWMIYTVFYPIYKEEKRENHLSVSARFISLSRTKLFSSFFYSVMY